MFDLQDKVLILWKLDAGPRGVYLPQDLKKLEQWKLQQPDKDQYKITELPIQRIQQ